MTARKYVISATASRAAAAEAYETLYSDSWGRLTPSQQDVFVEFVREAIEATAIQSEMSTMRAEAQADGKRGILDILSTPTSIEVHNEHMERTIIPAPNGTRITIYPDQNRMRVEPVNPPTTAEWLGI